MKRLQVLVEGSWHYVFCRNPLTSTPVLTTNKNKAVKGDALDYFKSKYASLEFRIV